MNTSTWTLLLEAHRLIPAAAEEPALDADALEELLTVLAGDLDAKILGRSAANYEPQRASATLLVGALNAGASATLHLDKSHLACHTYIDSHPSSDVTAFRASLELSTCGDLPLVRVLQRAVTTLSPDVLSLRVYRSGLVHDASGAPGFVTCDISFPTLEGFAWRDCFSDRNGSRGLAISAHAAADSHWQAVLGQIQ